MGNQLSEEALKANVSVAIPEAPHGLLWTHADEVNELLLFLEG